MIRRPIQRTTALILGIVSLLLLLGGYTWLSHRQHARNPKDTTIPTWSQLREGVVWMVKPDARSGERRLLADAKATAGRLSLGLGIGVVSALLVGMLMGCFTQVEAFCYPPLSLLAKVPPTAAIAIFFVMVGTDTSMFVSMIAFGIMPTLALTIYLAVKEFPEELQYKAYTLGATSTEVIYPMIFGYVLPKLIDTVRLAIGPALVYLIAAEIAVGHVGFGYQIRLQMHRTNMAVIYPYLAILAGFGFGMDYLLRWLQRRLCPWFEKARG